MASNKFEDEVYRAFTGIDDSLVYQPNGRVPIVLEKELITWSSSLCLEELFFKVDGTFSGHLLDALTRS